MKKLDLYDSDFYAWTIQQSALLRAGRFGEFDLEHVAEEIESIGKQLISNLNDVITLLQATALIHWSDSATKLSIKTMRQARSRENELLEEYPGLMCEMEKIVEESWSYAKNIAAVGHDEILFPESCPWAIAEMLTEHWFPEVKEKF